MLQSGSLIGNCVANNNAVITVSYMEVGVPVWISISTYYPAGKIQMYTYNTFDKLNFMNRLYNRAIGITLIANQCKKSHSKTAMVSIVVFRISSRCLVT